MWYGVAWQGWAFHPSSFSVSWIVGSELMFWSHILGCMNHNGPRHNLTMHGKSEDWANMVWHGEVVHWGNQWFWSLCQEAVSANTGTLVDKAVMHVACGVAAWWGTDACLLCLWDEVLGFIGCSIVIADIIGSVVGCDGKRWHVLPVETLLLEQTYVWMVSWEPFAKRICSHTIFRILWFKSLQWRFRRTLW